MKTSHLLSATALAGMLVLAPTGALAQATTADQTASEPTATPTATKPAEDIVVVGSHLRRNNLTTADPVQVITRDESTLAGFNSTAEVLQSSQVTGGTSQINNSFGGFVTAGGPGANTVSLRGLGTTRTLVLLNGRRIAPAGSRGQVGAADLTALPNAILNRIEVLNTGASSIYGSDAVAGVINLVTRNDVNGLILEGQTNIPEIGAGRTTRLSAIFGTHTGTFNLIGSVEYLERNTVTIGDVDFTKCQRALRRTAANPVVGSADLIDPKTGQPKCFGEISVTGDSGVTINTIGTANYAPGTVVLAPGVPSGQVCNRFRPNAAVTTGALPGYECVGGGTINTALRDTQPNNFFKGDLISPGRQYNGYLQGSVELPGLKNAEAYFEFLGNRRTSKQTSGSRQLTIDYPQNSPLYNSALIPGAVLGPQAGGITGTNNIGVRAFTEYGPYENRQTVDFVRALAGVRGDLIGDWRYDAYVMRSWSDSTYAVDTVLTDKIAQSLDVVPVAGGFACRNPLNGCVAAPTLSAATIGGQFPAAWFNFISETSTGHTKYRETIANLSFDGSLFALPGGNVSAAVGFEYRKARIDDTPGADSINGNLYGLTSAGVTRGTDSVKEAYAEIEAPVLADTPFFYRLTLNGSGRYTDYKSYGSQWTYKFGGVWAPAKFLSFRGSYGTSYRAPALFEQFLGATSAFASQNGDPCNTYAATFATTDNRYINCASLGLPGTFTANSSIQVNQQGGAATGLSAETSRAYTFGGVLEPDFGSLGRLSLGVDYFNLLVRNGVSQLSSANILSTCYDSAPADFTAKADTCALVKRNTTTPFALTVTTGYVNVSNAAVSGIDFTARYAVPLFDGTFRLNAAVTKFNSRYNQTLPTDVIRDLVGSVNNPRWTGTFDATYSWNKWTFRYGVEWLDGTNTTAFQAGTTDATLATYYFQTPDYFTHSASVQWRNDRFGITMGVRNLTNSGLPEISSGVYNRVGNVPLYSGYDYIGRTFFVNVTTKF